MKQYTDTLLTLNEFIDHIKTKGLTPKKELTAIRDYASFLNEVPKITDLVNFDHEGFYLADNTPIFKGFITCDESGTDEKKVPLKDNVRIFFFDNDKGGVLLQHENFITDECTWNEIAIAFNSKNKMKPLEFV
jgi:hypothetical protein